MKKSVISINSLAILFLLMFSAAYAIPNLISYQGVLNDKDGVPVSSTVSMMFHIYDVETAGTPLWSETQSVQVSNGSFNVQLGSVQQLPASVFEQDNLYLGIQVGSDQEMTPRQRITSGSYAYKAENAHKAELVGHSAIPIGTIMAWAKSIPGVPALPDGWVECGGQKLSDQESPLDGQIIPNLNGENRFLRGNTTSSGMGGSVSHRHKTAEIDSSGIHSNDDLGFGTYSAYGHHASVGYNSFYSHSGTETRRYTQTVSSLPTYYDVVWIMKIK